MTWNQLLIPKAPPEFSVSATGWGAAGCLGRFSSSIQFVLKVPGTLLGSAAPRKAAWVVRSAGVCLCSQPRKGMRLSLSYVSP